MYKVYNPVKITGFYGVINWNWDKSFDAFHPHCDIMTKMIRKWESFKGKLELLIIIIIFFFTITCLYTLSVHILS